MVKSLQESIHDCSQLSLTLSQNDEKLSYLKFKKYWDSISQPQEILKENLFKKLIASNFNYFEYYSIHHFIIEQAQKHLGTDYLIFLDEVNDFIFKDAIASNKTKNIKSFIKPNFSIEEGLQISIKYGAWDSFQWFLTNHVSDKQKKKVIQWSQKEFWQYAISGYANIDFIKKLIDEPLSVNTPIKQPIYSLLKDYNFDFINEFINDSQCFSLLNEMNVEHYYKLLLKHISEKKEDSYYLSSGLNLLISSSQVFDYSLEKISLSTNFKKQNPDIIQFIEKIILKEKLELFSEKKDIKRLKI